MEEKKEKKEETETKEMPMDNLMKQKLADMVMNLGKGRGMNTQEYMAIKNYFKKNKLDINEMMQMMMMKKMMGDDGGKKMNPIEMMMIMQFMNSGSSKESEYQKKIEELQKQMIEERKMSELKGELAKLSDKIKDSKGDFGIKEWMTLMAERDKKDDKWKSENERLRNEILMKEVSGAIGSLSEEMKKIKEGGGDIERVGKTVEVIRKLSDDLGFGKEKKDKSGTELAKELVENVTKSLAPAINRGVEALSTKGNPGLSQQQAQVLQRIQQQRQESQSNTQPQTNIEPADEEQNINSSYKDDAGRTVYPSVFGDNLVPDKKDMMKRKRE